MVVFDDIQWGEEMFLDLVESTALLSAGAQILLLCMARPELVERRPTWPAALRLEPLPPEDADALIGDAVSGELRERIARAAGGNPLFISEMLAMAAGNAEVEVPPTLKALLAARLDQLDEPERRVLEHGSVEGEIFHRGAVQALTPEETQVTTRLAALVRHQLVRPDRAQLAGDDGYRFRHLLIRDAAYDALPKAVRADLHARFADWLDEHGQALVELDEIVGYHLEQAARYLAELGQPDPSSPNAPPCGSPPPAGARTTASTAGPRSRCSTRAVELLRPHRLELALELEAAWATAEVDGRAAAQAADAVAERAEAARRPLRRDARARDGPLPARDQRRARLERRAGGALPRCASPRGAARRSQAARAALVRCIAGRRAFSGCGTMTSVAALRASAPLPPPRRRLPVVRHAGVEWSLILGPRPADEALRMLDELAPGRPPGDGDLARAVLLAMLGRIDEAWPLAEARSNHLREVTGGACGGEGHLAADRVDRRRPAARVPAPRRADRRAPARQRRRWPRRAGCRLARDLCYLGRFDEAEPSYRQAQAVAAGPVARAMAPPSRRSSSPRAASSSRRRLSPAQASPRRRPRRTTVAPGLGATRTSPRCSSAQAGSTTRARRSSARSPSGSESAACPTRAVSVSRSTRSGGRRSDRTERLDLGSWSAVSTSPGEGSVTTRGRVTGRSACKFEPFRHAMGM